MNLFQEIGPLSLGFRPICLHIGPAGKQNGPVSLDVGPICQGFGQIS